MFQESKDLPVTAPARVGKNHVLAKAIRRGGETVVPTKGSYNVPEGCVLCALAVGLRLPAGMALTTGSPTRRILNKRFGAKLIREIEMRFEGWHRRKPMTFAEIADWLDSQSL